MLQAAQRLQSLDAELAWQTYLEAMVAAVYAGRLARGQDARQAARAALAATPESPGPEPRPHSQLLIHGLAVRLADGYLAAAPALKEGLRRYRARPHQLDWLSVSYNVVAMDLWDDEAWFELADGQARLARANGTLSWLPFALDYLAEFHVQAGELSKAAALLMERERVDQGTREATLPYVPLLLTAWRGDAPGAGELAEEMARGAADRGEGAALTYTDYAQAVLYNGLGNYRPAAEAAHGASAVDEIVISPWALYELVEAAARSDQQERARAAADQLSQLAVASGSNWARGAAARSRALVSRGRTAEEEYRAAIELLGSTRMAAHLARARLLYGEWLRRENRRTEARVQLRSAFDALASMGAEAFAERARRELQATGEKVRKRSEDTRADLTPQEEEIARLAHEGRTNQEIGAQLFLSTRTVEWHLSKVFAKLDISSRRDLEQALKKEGPAARRASCRIRLRAAGNH
jgi:DNA-binding CsgD family transcriptional regulator